MNRLERPRSGTSASPEGRVRNGIRMWQTELPHLDSSGKEVCGRVIALAGVLNHLFNDALAPFDLKYHEYGVLATLRASGSPYSLTQKQLLETILFSSGGMSNLLTRLEKKRLITRVNDTEDRRVVHVHLSETGLAVANDAMATQSATETAFSAVLSDTEREALISALGKLLDASREI